MFIDTHAHIEGSEFDSDREEVIQRTFEAGVQGWINISNGIESFKRSCEIASKHPEVSISVGVHPHDAASVSQEELELLAKEVGHPKVVAVGETGLDYYYKNAPVAKQKELFDFFLNCAKDSGLPLSIHMREAEEDFLAFFDRVFPQGGKGVMHCFTSHWEFAKECLERGFYISFSGIVTFKKAEQIQEVAQKVPLEKMLIETDAPFLTPEPFRGKRNEPAFVVKTAEKIASLRGISVEELAEQTTRNAKALFNLD